MPTTLPAYSLSTVDPDAPLDDLAALLDIIGDARVVALGEHNHHTVEYNLLRHRILRLLVEKAGFTVHALETGLADGGPVNDWVHGGPGEISTIVPAATGYLQGEAEEVHTMLRWMRAHNATASRPVRFTGVDLPSASGSAAPALRAIEPFLRRVDADAVPLWEEAWQATAAYSGPSSAVALHRHGTLGAPARNRATQAVDQLLAHVETHRHDYESRSDAATVDHVVHHARAVAWLDAYLREVPGGEIGRRDDYMAETVRLLLRRDPDARIVLALHNGHIQRVPLTFAGSDVTLHPTGQVLADELGEDYVAVGMTCGGGTTAGLAMDPEAPLGFTVHETPLPPLRDGQVETHLTSAGPCLVDLRGLTHASPTAPELMRHAHTVLHTRVFDAFDALIHLPTTRPSAFIGDPDAAHRHGAVPDRAQ